MSTRRQGGQWYGIPPRNQHIHLRYPHESLPDFARDPAWVVRMMDENHLSKTCDIVENRITARVWNAFTDNPTCEGEGEDRATPWCGG